MKPYSVAIVAMLTVWAAPSHAQYYDPGMVNNQANIFLNAEINRVTIDSGSARSSGSSSRSRPSQRSTNAPIPPRDDGPT